MKHLIESLNKFKGRKILVVGDLVMDKFVRGTVSRISPEAPIPVVEVTDEKIVPGAAGNVASNLLSLGAEVFIASVTGGDFYGTRLTKMLKEMGADVESVFIDSSRPTSIKTRIIAQHQQVVRVDKESKEEITAELTEKLIEKISTTLIEVDAVIISDYGKGLISTTLIESILYVNEKSKKKIPVVVDPQIGHFFEYKCVTSITPNINETTAALKIKILDEAALDAAGKKLLDMLKCDSVLITRGDEGMSLFQKDGKVDHIPTVAREVYDVTGAGDTVVSVYTLALSSGLNFYDAAVLSNYAAAVVVGKLGTATVSLEEIDQRVRGCK